MRKSYFDLKLSELNILVLLAETNSIRELSRRQGIQPSQVSKTIKKIEEKLQINILQRSSSRVSFTLEGMELLKVAREILKASSNLGSEKTNLAPTTPIVTLASLSFLNKYLIPDCMSALEKQKHDFHFRLLEIPMKDLLVAGIKGHFEISLHIGKMDWPGTWTSKEVGFLQSGLYARVGHHINSNCSESKLISEKFVTPLRWTKNGTQAGQDNCPLPVTKRLHGHGAVTADVALSLIQSSDQLAYLPQIVAKDLLKKKLIKQIKVKEWEDKPEVIYLSVHSEKVGQKLFMDLIQQIKKQI